MGEILSLLLLAGGGAYYYAETLTYRVSRFERTGGAGVYPRIIIIGLFVFIALRIIQKIAEKDWGKFVFLNLFRGRRGIFFFAFFFYVLLMPFLGYLADTAAYLLFASGYLTFLREGSLGDRKRIALRTLLFLAMVGGIYWFFVAFLNVSVPAGLLSRFV
jgi:hypothetical protein